MNRCTLRVWSYIAQHADNLDICEHSVVMIANAIGYSVPAVYQSLDKLKAGGYLTKVHGYRLDQQAVHGANHS